MPFTNWVILELKCYAQILHQCVIFYKNEEKKLIFTHFKRRNENMVNITHSNERNGRKDYFLTTKVLKSILNNREIVQSIANRIGT